MAKFKTLEDVEERAKECSDSFFIPDLEERRSQKVGYSVRLHFLLDGPVDSEPHAERMWVTVTQECDESSSYKGVLENQPTCIEDLDLDDEITFLPSHIAQTIIKKGDPRWIECSQLKALVSNMCLEHGGTVGFLYRENPDNSDDSGWRMFSGYESDEYANDFNNISIIEVGYMLDKDPTLLIPLKEPIGAVFEREEPKTPWDKVTDWNPCE